MLHGTQSVGDCPGEPAQTATESPTSTYVVGQYTGEAVKSVPVALGHIIIRE
jgi:hypothetical protein